MYSRAHLIHWESFVHTDLAKASLGFCQKYLHVSVNRNSSEFELLKLDCYRSDGEINEIGLEDTRA